MNLVHGRVKLLPASTVDFNYLITSARGWLWSLIISLKSKRLEKYKYIS
jgi:hypothetical protein